ncbi:MAG: DUF4303 domain-containing protein [Firmicutes bacterium]|nr:DUF4303 domain-containing protein [Bacillota bacterium]
MYDIQKKEIEMVLTEAAKNCFSSLFKKHNEDFYYCALILSDGAAPFISAWSYEALVSFLEKNSLDIETELPKYKWSYADSPYCGYGYNEFFSNAAALYNKNIENTVSEDEEERVVKLWIDAMESTMKYLDSIGLFGDAEKRKHIFINAEIMPPVYENSVRAKRLNPDEIYAAWADDGNVEESQTEDKSAYYRQIYHPLLCSVKLLKPVSDKKTVIKLKKAVGFEGGIQSFIQICKKAPCVLKHKARYNDIIKTITDDNELGELLEVEKTDDYWH